MVKFLEIPSGGIRMHLTNDDIGKEITKNGKSAVKIVKICGEEPAVCAVVEFKSGYKKTEYIGDYKPVN